MKSEIESNFNIGDTVIVVSDTMNAVLQKGDKGVIVLIDNGGWIGVDWYKNVCGHTCSNTCVDTHGWIVSPEKIKKTNDYIKMNDHILKELEQYYE